MCLLAIHFQVCADAPLLIAANREEFYARPSLPPAIQPGTPRVLCGIDARAGGTWLGVNEYGLVVAVTNRRKPDPPPAPRSRGLLCRELLNFANAVSALSFAYQELATGAYDGANFACLDGDDGAVIHAGRRLEMVKLSPGLHLVTAGDVSDPADYRQTLARRLFADRDWAGPREFVEVAKRVCSRGPVGDCPGIVLRGDGRGTVSSTILGITRRAEESFYRFAAGAPDTTPYQDYSELLRSLLVTGSDPSAGHSRGGSI
jgi:hypothetical protein